jgi:hypothetical protein
MTVLRALEAENGCLVVPVHWSHDPAKDAEWAATERLKLTRAGWTEADWNREMELDFGALSGAVAYPAFNEGIHVVDDLVFHPDRPLCWAWDFNVSPMTSTVSQINGGVLDIHYEIVKDNPGTVEAVCNEFRNLFPNHKAEVRVYGDASGNNRGQTARSSYDLIRIAMGGYPARLVFNVPSKNPHPRERVDAVNFKLKPADGVPGVRVHARNRELIRDFKEVRMKPDGKDIEKTYKLDDPYAKRTHLSDGLGYLVWREFPVGKAGLDKPKPRPKMVFDTKKLLGGMR